VDIEKTINELGGIASRSQLYARGFSGGDITTAVRLGLTWRVRRAHYVTSAAQSEAILAVRVGGRLAGISAARSYGLWAGFDRRIHVAVAANAARLRTQFAPSKSDYLTPDIAPREIELHWLARLETNAECWRVTLDECLVQVLQWSDAETAVACLDTARRQFGLTDADLARIFAGQNASVRVKAGASRPGSDSGVESIVRQRLKRIGVEVEQQVEIPVVGRVDMLVRSARLVIEVDSKGYHSSPEQFENDRRRGAELAAIDHRELRLSFQRVFEEWAWCERTVLAALGRG
jgi:very-short-patch-repair endonuclease